MKHALIESSTDTQIATASEAADWLLDAIACATQDKSLLRGEDNYNDLLGGAILQNGVIACLRAMKA
jgi:hypothetical protein